MRSFCGVVLIAALFGASPTAAQKGSIRSQKERRSSSSGGSSRDGGHSFAVQHSFDGATWSTKGSLVVGEFLQVVFEPAFEKWDDSHANALRDADTYYVRVASAPNSADAEAGGAAHTQLAVAPCQLANAGWYEHYRVTFAPHDDNKAWVIGLAPFGSAYAREHSPDYCKEPSAFTAKVDNMRGADHRVIMADRPPQRAPVFTQQDKEEAIYKQPENKRAKPPGQEGEGGEEKQPKSFFERYWIYILLFLVITMLQGQAAGTEPAQGGRGGGGGGRGGGGGGGGPQQ